MFDRPPFSDHVPAQGKLPSQGKGPLVIRSLIGVGLIVAVGEILQALPRQPSPPPPPPTCKTDWSKCTDNRDLMKNNDGIFSARWDCKSAATKLATYGTPEFPRYDAFGTFYKGSDYITTGIATLVETEAKFQNGFGAMAHMRVVCTFDLRANKVTDVFALPD